MLSAPGAIFFSLHNRCPKYSTKSIKFQCTPRRASCRTIIINMTITRPSTVIADVIERILSNTRHTTRDIQLHITAIIKRIRTDRRNTVRNIDRRQKSLFIKTSLNAADSTRGFSQTPRTFTHISPDDVPSNIIRSRSQPRAVRMIICVVHHIIPHIRRSGHHSRAVIKHTIKAPVG